MENAAIIANVAAKVAYLKSVQVECGHNIPAILRNEAAYLRTKKAAHNHTRAAALEAAASEFAHDRH